DGILHLANDELGIRNYELSLSNLPSTFYTFTRPDSPPDYDFPVDFGQVIHLHGYTLHFDRQEEIQVTVDLEALQPLNSIQPVLYLLDADGQPLGATSDVQPTLVWYPVEQWPVGDIIRVRFNTLPWYTRSMPAYHLAFGMVSGADVWDTGSRHRPAFSQPTEVAPRLPADGTLIELARIKQRWSMPEGGPVMRQFESPALAHRLDANFGDQIRLLGYRELTPLKKQSTTVAITLGWQARSPAENWVRFVQLIGPDGLVYGQYDSAPDNGLYPTSLWQPGEVVVDPVAFPILSERPPGDYILHIGLYQPDTGERLLLNSGGDHITVSVPD
ncbi:MAG: hypothetical protein KDJ52_13720, partial [Anaerolineae bacterium]|nr:hypothetical protein [Anaerolineae bacterium]